MAGQPLPAVSVPRSDLGSELLPRLPVSIAVSTALSTGSSTCSDSVFIEVTNKSVLTDSSVERPFLNGVCRPLNQGCETQ